MVTYIKRLVFFKFSTESFIETDPNMDVIRSQAECRKGGIAFMRPCPIGRGESVWENKNESFYVRNQKLVLPPKDAIRDTL